MPYGSTGYVNGSDFGLYVDDTLIAVGIENTFQRTKNAINVSNKDSGKEAEYIYGRGDGTVSGSCRFKYDAGYGYLDLDSIMDNETVVTIRVSNGTSGDDEKSFSALLVDLQVTNPDDENSTVQYTFQKTGAVTTTNIT